VFNEIPEIRGWQEIKISVSYALLQTKLIEEVLWIFILSDDIN
jgi:hypothetical protein